MSWPYFASADSSIVSQHDAMFIQHGNNEENYLEVVKVKFDVIVVFICPLCKEMSSFTFAIIRLLDGFAA